MGTDSKLGVPSFCRNRLARTMSPRDYMRRRLELLGLDVEEHLARHEAALLLQAAAQGYTLQGWDIEPSFLNIGD